jgi:putative endonuclease
VSTKAQRAALSANPRRRHALGRAAEEYASRHLREHGCAILARRYGRRGGEIDLVVEDEGVVVFVEVKARGTGAFGDPAEAVTPRKRRRIVATARRFLAEQAWRGRACRFDVVAVHSQRGKATLVWLRDAFRP